MKAPIYFIASLLAVALPASAQELTLFEGSEREQAEQPQQSPRLAPPGNRPGAPAFTLRGTSRFGDEYSVSLSSGGNEQQGESIQVDWTHGGAADIPGHPGYQVLEVSARTASIKLPGGSTCHEYPDQGVECRNDGSQLLTLTTAKPLAPSEPEGPQQEGRTVFNPFTGENEVVPPLSEEEQRAREERQRERAARLQQFQPVRIPDEDVPEGMRKVSTPFGDRLVPDNQ